MTDLHFFLRDLLIQAGVVGCSQQQLTYDCRNKAKAGEIKLILKEWRKKEYVQKFVIPSKAATRPKTIWRATEKILELS